MGMQLMAYGGSKPVPFQQAICESQTLEPGITGNFTADAMQLLVEYLGCNTTSLDSEETVTCLRGFDKDTLMDASLATYIGEPTTLATFGSQPSTATSSPPLRLSSSDRANSPT